MEWMVDGGMTDEQQYQTLTTCNTSFDMIAGFLTNLFSAV